MIYKKLANFPYPILTSFNTGYEDGEFDMELKLDIIGNHFVFVITPIISSWFLIDLLNHKKAKMFMIVKDKSSAFYPLEYKNKMKIEIPINRLSIKDNPSIQLMIQSTEDISYENNNDLNPFYDAYKKDMMIEKGKLLGYSKVSQLMDFEKHGYDLFEILVDEDLNSEVDIRLETEVIKIVCKSAEIEFGGIENGNIYQYPYVYMGLQKALIAFLNKYADEKNIEDAEIDFTIEQHVADEGLFIKLNKLMEAKGIEVLNFRNIDEVIFKITDHIIGSYAKMIGDKDYEDI